VPSKNIDAGSGTAAGVLAETVTLPGAPPIHVPLMSPAALKLQTEVIEAD